MYVVGFILIVISIFLLYYLFKCKRYPPGPIALPYLGNILILKKYSKRHNGLANAFRELSKEYNTNALSLTIAGNYTVVVQSKTLIDEVLKGKEYEGRPDNFFIRLRSMGARRGITMTDGPFWKEQRSFAVKHLHEYGLGTRKMNSMIQRQCKRLLSELKNSNVSNVVLRKSVAKCVLNVLWEIVTGSPFKDEKTMAYLFKLMEDRSKVFDVCGGLISQFPWIRYFFPNYSGYAIIQKINNKFKEMMLNCINEHKATYSKEEPRDFIDAFINEMYTKASPTTFTDEQLIMVCLDFFIGGSQTTSNTLDFSFLFMTINQDIQEKVQKELDAVLLPGQVPSIEDRNKCQYVEAVLLEVQRLTPVAPVIGPRRATSDSQIGDYFIPKDTTILLNIQSVNDGWDEPEKFKPERFLDEEGKIKLDQTLYNFGKGKRRCPAEVLAKNSLFILFSGLLHNYKLDVVNEENPPTLRVVPGITTSPFEYSIKLTNRFKTDDNK